MPLAHAALLGDTGSSLPALRCALRLEAVLCPVTGLAAWLVWRRIDIGLERKRAALRRWGWMLMMGALWPVAATAAHGPALALLVACFAAAVVTAAAFRRVQTVAAILLLPYAATLVVTIARF